MLMTTRLLGTCSDTQEITKGKRSSTTEEKKGVAILEIMSSILERSSSLHMNMTALFTPR